MAMIQTVLPFQNYIVMFDVTGERIKQVLQETLFNNTKFIGSFPQVKAQLLQNGWLHSESVMDSLYEFCW